MRVLGMGFFFILSFIEKSRGSRIQVLKKTKISPILNFEDGKIPNPGESLLKSRVASGNSRKKTRQEKILAYFYCSKLT